MKRDKRLRIAFLILFVLFSGLCSSAQTVFISDTASWDYTFREIPGWFDSGFSDTALSVGKAPFGNFFAMKHGWHYTTEFPEWSTLYVRKTFRLGHDFDDMQVEAAWDNILVVYVNGVKLDSADKVGFASKWQRTIPIPGNILKADSINVIAAKVIDYGGGTGFTLTLTGTGTIPVDIAENRRIHMTIQYSRPSSLNRVATVRFDLPAPMEVRILIYNSAGKLMRRLVRDEFNAGMHEVEWDLRDASGRTVPGGTYLYKLSAGKIIVRQNSYVPH